MGGSGLIRCYLARSYGHVVLPDDCYLLFSLRKTNNQKRTLVANWYNYCMYTMDRSSLQMHSYRRGQLARSYGHVVLPADCYLLFSLRKPQPITDTLIANWYNYCMYTMDRSSLHMHSYPHKVMLHRIDLVTLATKCFAIKKIHRAKH